MAEILELAGQLDRIVNGELGAGADGEMAVWAASPISTTWERPLKWLHAPQIRRLKLSQAEPRRWRALVISSAPSRTSANSFSQKAMEPS